MKEPYKKGVASRLARESCMPSRKAGHEALTGVQAGRAIEPRNGAYFRGPTLSSKAEGNRARYAFLVRLFHPLLNAGLSRRSKLKHAPPRRLVGHALACPYHKELRACPFQVAHPPERYEYT